MVVKNRNSVSFIKRIFIYPFVFIFSKTSFHFENLEVKKALKEAHNHFILVANKLSKIDRKCLISRYGVRYFYEFDDDNKSELMSKLCGDLKDFKYKNRILIVNKSTDIHLLDQLSVPMFKVYSSSKYGFLTRPVFLIGSYKTDFRTLEHKVYCIDKYKTQTFFTLKYFVYDLIKQGTYLLSLITLTTRKYYIGTTKQEIRKASSFNCIVCSNHIGPMDPPGLYLSFLYRRIRLVSISQIWENKFLAFILKWGGVIKYRRDEANRVDIKGFKEIIETLEGNGIIGIFPEGHINFDGAFDKEIKSGAAMMSLMTNSPIIPFAFVDRYGILKINKVLLGKPLYPSDYFEIKTNPSIDDIRKWNEIIYTEMNKLYKISLARRKTKKKHE